MVKHRGIKWLTKGVVRKLTVHEIKRGYIYISQGTRLREILDTKDFEVTILGKVYPSRRIDVSGRVHIPPPILKNIGTEQLLCIRLISRNKLDIELLKKK